MFATRDTGIATPEALALLVKKKQLGIECQLGDAHYGIGWKREGFWYSYYCCDTCDNYEHESELTLEQLVEHLKYNDGPWYVFDEPVA